MRETRDTVSSGGSVHGEKSGDINDSYTCFHLSISFLRILFQKSYKARLI